MKIYEITDPYAAVIQARSQEEAVVLYNADVCNTEDYDDVLSIKEIDPIRMNKIIGSLSEENKKEVQDLLKGTSHKPVVLLVTGELF